VDKIADDWGQYVVNYLGKLHNDELIAYKVLERTSYSAAAYFMSD
jgi:hypothetical protein